MPSTSTGQARGAAPAARLRSRRALGIRHQHRLGRPHRRGSVAAEARRLSARAHLRAARHGRHRLRADRGAAGAAGARCISGSPTAASSPQPLPPPVDAGIFGRRRRAVFDRARLSPLSANAAARRHARRRAHPAAGNGRADEPQPYRRPAGRRADAATMPELSNDVDLFPGRAGALGSRLYAQPGARAERAQRRHGELGRALQQLLLARPGAPRRRRDPDADPALRRSGDAAALLGEFERGVYALAEAR